MARLEIIVDSGAAENKVVNLTTMLTNLENAGVKLDANMMATSKSIIAMGAAADKSAVAQSKLAQVSAQAATTMQGFTAALDKAILATNNSAASQIKLNAALMQGQASAQALITEQIKQAAATVDSVAATDLAIAATQRLIAANEEYIASAAARTAATRTASESAVVSGGVAGAGIGGLGSAIAVGAGIAVAANASDTYTLLENKLRSVGVQEDSLQYSMQKLAQTALDTRSSFEQTATSFQRLDVATSGLKVSQLDVLGVVRTLNESIQMSGATAQAAKAGLYQLTEGMEANRFQGIHLKAFITDLPMLAKSVAAALDTNLSGLREMGKKGELTAEVMFGALQKVQKETEDLYGKSMPTIASAFSNLNTHFITYTGELNSASGASHAFVTALNAIGNNLDKVLGVAMVVGGVLLTAFSVSMIGKVIQFGAAIWEFTKAISALNIATLLSTERIGLMTAAMAANPLGVFVIAATAAAAAIELFGDKVTVATIKVDGMKDKVAVTLKDEVVATFQVIGNALSKTVDYLETSWSSMIDHMNTKSKDLKDPSFMARVGSAIATTAGQINDAPLNAAIAINRVQDFGGKGFVTDFGNAMIHSGKEISNGFLAPLLLMRGATENMKTAVSTQAAKNAEARAKLNLGEFGKGAGGATGHTEEDKAGKPAKSSADAEGLAKLNAQLDSQIKNMFELSDVRKLHEAQDKIEIQYGMKKIDINGNIIDNSKHISEFTRQQIELAKQKTKTVYDEMDAQKSFDSVIATSSIQANKNYESSIKGVNRALKDGQVTEYEALQARIKAADQLALIKEAPRLEQVGKDQAQNAIYKSVRDLSESTTHTEQSKGMGSNQKAQFDLEFAIQKKYNDEILAAQDAMNLEVRTKEKEALRVKIELLKDAKDKEIQIIQSTKAYKEATDRDKLQQEADFFGNMATIFGENNTKMGRIGKAAAIAQATINTYLSATKAYSSLAEIPIIGPALGAAAAGAAIAAGLANIAQIRSAGYADGGYTGNGGKYDVAGVVHKGEVVWSQDDVRRAGGVSAVEMARKYGYSNQNYLQDSAPPRPQSQSTSNTSTMPNITIHNHGFDDAIESWMKSSKSDQHFVNKYNRNKSSLSM